MTTVIRPQASTTAGGWADRATSTSAEVWDIADSMPFAASTRNCHAVRPLARETRTFERAGVAKETGLRSARGEFEPGRENRDNFILGSVLTAALLIGSAFGGVFTNQEGQAQSESTAVQVASAQLR